MTTSFDLILLPLSRQDGQDQPELMGLHAAAAPRRAARGRSLDRLVIHLSLVGTAPLSATGYAKLLDHLTQLYFKSTGSSTAAMRGVAEWLNEYLLERNQRGLARGMQAAGILTLAVLRGNRLYLAQSGPGHAFWVTADGPKHLHDPQMAGRGLGLGRATNLRYHQMEVSSQDFLLISGEPVSSWTPETLGSLQRSSLGNLRRRLLQAADSNLAAALLALQAGSGAIRVLRTEPAREEPPQAQIDSTPAEPVPLSQEPLPARESEMTFIGGEAAPEETAPSQTDPAPPVFPASRPPAPAVSVAEPSLKVSPPPQKPERTRLVGPALLKMGQSAGDLFRQLSKSVGALVKQMLPDESLFSIPPTWMAFIAVAIPLIVVAVSASVYFQRGQRQKYEENYLKARYAADQALQLSEPNDLRTGWGTVLAYLDQAESVYQPTEETQTMRVYAQNVLDGLDNVVRLGFQPALGSALPGAVEIKHLVVANEDTELYLLDAVEGRVYRTTLTDRGYVLDSNFICEPIPQSASLIVGKLVDIVVLPLGDPNNAVVMGVDGNGNLLQCIPGGKAPLAVSMPPPDMNWGTPLAFAMDSTDLYVLDPVTNAVWIFWGRDGYTERPQLFFDAEVPPMGDVIDLTVYREDLYLLHEDGSLTTCTFGFPTRCTDLAEVHNLPEGYNQTSFFDQVKFGELQFVSTPNPSLYLLDKDVKAVYQLSRTLAYHQQYRAQSPLPEGPATTFTVSQNHQVFIAIGNQVYFAPLP